MILFSYYLSLLYFFIFISLFFSFHIYVLVHISIPVERDKVFDVCSFRFHLLYDGAVWRLRKLNHNTNGAFCYLSISLSLARSHCCSLMFRFLWFDGFKHLVYSLTHQSDSQFSLKIQKYIFLNSLFLGGGGEQYSTINQFTSNALKLSLIECQNMHAW